MKIASVDLTALFSRGAFSLGQLLAYLLRFGAFGFGGPIALAGCMQRDVVEQRAASHLRLAVKMFVFNVRMM
jgi:chromate transport protein ChrA